MTNSLVAEHNAILCHRSLYRLMGQYAAGGRAGIVVRQT